MIPGAAVQQYNGGVINEAGWLQSPYELFVWYRDTTVTTPSGLGMPQMPPGTVPLRFKTCLLYTSPSPRD